MVDGSLPSSHGKTPPVIRRLDRGKLHVPRGGLTKGKVKTCRKYKDANGKTRYQGTRHLRATELLDVDLYTHMFSIQVLAYEWV